MADGRLNRVFGWTWLIVWLLFGAYLELKLGDPVWSREAHAFPREVWRAAHAHGNLLSILNILYGHFLASAALGDGARRLGSGLMVLGALLFPLGLVGVAFAQPFINLTPLGGACVVVAAGIMAYGQWKAR